MSWLGNITDDMTYNYVEYNWKDFDFSLTYKDYGQQRHTDEMGVVLNNFSPNSFSSLCRLGNTIELQRYTDE